jgi:hypothetical protein
MERTYWAVLHKGRLEWMGTQPEIDPDRQVEVKVVISDEQAYAPRYNEEAVNALREIAISGGVQSIKDPVAWQREVRKDRPLPGRD